MSRIWYLIVGNHAFTFKRNVSVKNSHSKFPSGEIRLDGDLGLNCQCWSGGGTVKICWNVEDYGGN